MNVPIANVRRSPAMESAAEGCPSQEPVEGLARGRDVPRVTEGCERGFRARLLDLDLPLDDLQGADLDEGAHPEGFHGLSDLLHVREERDDGPADPQSLPRRIDGGPGIRQV